MIVESWMTRSPVAVSPTVTISVALSVLAHHRFRRLLVLDGDQLVGLVTKGDLLRVDSSEEIHTVMSRSVVTVTATTPLEEAAKVMIDRKVGALPVLDVAGRVCGILTESDAMRALIASLGVGGPGVRLTLRGTHPESTIEFLVRTAHRHHMKVLALLVTGVDEDRRVLARFSGTRGDALINETFAAGYVVMSAQRY